MDEKDKQVILNEFRKLLPEHVTNNFENIPIALLGIDSLDFLDLQSYLEDTFAIDIPIIDLDDSMTLRAFIDCCQQVN